MFYPDRRLRTTATRALCPALLSCSARGNCVSPRDRLVDRDDRGCMQTYCERCGPGLFDEPINAASNIAFLLAAWAAWRLAARSRGRCAGMGLLISLCVAVGVGSTLWHTFATRWAMVLDVVPITLFQLCFLWLY